MVSIPRLPRVFLVLAALAGALRLSHRRQRAAEDHIAALEAESAWLASEAQRALRMRDDFLATLSHELRTPLNAMLGWVRLLRLHADDPSLRTHAIDVIERNARTQAQLVNDLLDVSRIITGRMHLTFTPVDLASLVAAGVEALTPTATAKHMTLVVEADPIRGTVEGDAARLQQVVWNLVSNAIRFTPHGGRVTVRLRHQNGSAEISVTDSGIGIAADVLPFVFDRFRQGDSSLTRTAGGLGLGLAVVRHLVELHGGTVQAVSEGPNRGSTFYARLPIRSGEHAAA
jgi:signal transduction histidine kinase